VGGGDDRRILTLILVQPQPDRAFRFSGPERLQPEPRHPVVRSLTRVAVSAAAYQVRSVSLSAFTAWPNVIQRCGWFAAISAAVLPCFEYRSPELTLGVTTWHKVAAIDAVIHLISEDGR